MINIFCISQDVLPNCFDEELFFLCKDISEADFIWTPEGEAACYHSEKFALANNKYHVPYKALKKLELYNSFKEMEVDVIPTVKVTSKSDIENLPYDKLFLKPNVYSGGFLGVSKVPELYWPISKEQAISYLPKHNTGDGLVVQPFLTGESTEANLIMVPGVVNSSGKIHFQKCLDVVHKLGEGIVHSVRGNLALEIKEHVQELTAKYIKYHSIRNTVFLMQFIKVDGKFLPMDFQYRLSYFERLMIIKKYPRYIKDLNSYAFNAIDEVPYDPTEMQFFYMIDIPEDKDAVFVKSVMNEMGVFMLNLRQRTDRKRLFYFIGADYDTIMNNINLFKERLCV